MSAYLIESEEGRTYLTVVSRDDALAAVMFRGIPASLVTLLASGKVDCLSATAI